MKPIKIIECECRCGGKLEDRDSRGRPRKFLPSHWSRVQPHTKEETRCENCGKAVVRPKWYREKVNHLFCGATCKGQWMTANGTVRGENNGHYNSVTVPCSGCDQPVTKPHSLVYRRNNRVYCDACTLRKNPDGPVSWSDYPKEFSKALRAEIRERDHHECQWCGKTSSEVGTMDVHHIDYNKHNNDPTNLISLCESCHGQTNYGQERWKVRLWAIVNRIYGLS